MMRRRGLEPPRLTAYPPQGQMSTNFNTGAWQESYLNFKIFSIKILIDSKFDIIAKWI